MDKTTLENLNIKKAINGSSIAFEFLVKKNLDKIYRFCLGYLKSQAEAEDAVQEIFVKVWKNLKNYDVNKPFNPWLYQIAKNTCLDILKKKRISLFSEIGEEGWERQILDISDSPELIVEKNMLRVKIGKSMEKLSPLYNEVVGMHSIQGMSFAEIAHKTKQSINTVKSRYRRAINILRHLF